MASVRNALIVGAGIGGLSAAVALRRVGIAVDVIEIKPTMTVFGVGIIQPSNAIRALDRIGLAEACLASGGGFPGWRLYDGGGAMFGEVPGRNVAAPGMPATNGLPRQTLHHILEDATLAAGATLRYGRAIERLEDTGEIVRVTFEDGEAAEYDLVVGADGAYSRTRQALFGDVVKPEFTGQGCWRCNLVRPADMEWGAAFYGRKTKIGLVPQGPDTMYLFCVTDEPGNPRYEHSQLAPTLRAHLEEYGGMIPALREQINEHSLIVYKPMESLLMPQPWHQGRTVLIGDAVHSTTPHLAQGASLAIEDAVLLADALANDGPLDAALDAFTLRRFPRAKLVVESSVQLGQWEMAEWRGAPDPAGSFGGLMHHATEKMMEPI